jgi:hypothetical protein
MATRNIQVAIAEIFKLKNRTFITYFLVVQGPLKSCPSLPPTHERKNSLPLTLLLFDSFFVELNACNFGTSFGQKSTEEQGEMEETHGSVSHA